jgi:outer membrane lipoprotein-sorting protein
MTHLVFPALHRLLELTTVPLYVFALCLVFSGGMAQAQPTKKNQPTFVPPDPNKAPGMASDPKAVEILKTAEQKYSALKTASVDFTQTTQFAGKKDKPIPVKGNMKLKGDRFKVELEDVQIFCDGKTQWYYLPKDKEVTVSKYDPIEGFNPASVFRFSQKDMKSKYDALETLGNQKVHRLSLFPRSANTEILRIELWVRDADRLPQKVKIVNRRQTVTTYELGTIDSTTPLADNLFMFEPAKFPGVELIDNR